MKKFLPTALLIGIFLLALHTFWIPSELEAKQKYTICHGCGRFGVDVEELAQENVLMRYRSIIVQRGGHMYPGCKFADEINICFVAGYALYCGQKRVLDVYTTEDTAYCSNYLR